MKINKNLTKDKIKILELISERKKYLKSIMGIYAPDDRNQFYARINELKVIEKKIIEYNKK